MKGKKYSGYLIFTDTGRFLRYIVREKKKVERYVIRYCLAFEHLRTHISIKVRGPCRN